MRVQSLLVLAAGLVAGAVGGYLLAASPTQAASTQVPAWLEVVQRVCTSVGGLGTFAGFGPVHPDIAWQKLRAMAEGARIATRKLWGHAEAA